MASLENVVSAMSKESNNSTLGWDVVVNYRYANRSMYNMAYSYLRHTSAEDLNRLLKDAYDAGSAGQLKDLNV